MCLGERKNGRRGPEVRELIFTTRIRAKNKISAIKNSSGRFFAVNSLRRDVVVVGRVDAKFSVGLIS